MVGKIKGNTRYIGTHILYVLILSFSICWNLIGPIAYYCISVYSQYNLQLYFVRPILQMN